MKKYRIQMVFLFLFLAHLNAKAQLPSSSNNMSGIKIISAVDIVEEIDGQPARVSTVELTIQPKQESSPHRHPGPVYGYVLEGVYEFKVEGKPLRLLKQGDTFYEPLMALHEVGRNPSNESVAKILAILAHPRSAKNLIIPENTIEVSE